MPAADQPGGAPRARAPAGRARPSALAPVPRPRERAPAPAPSPGRRGLGLVSSYRLLVAVILILVAIGVVMVLSASSVVAFAEYGNSYAVFKKQLVWALVGLAIMLAVSRVDYRRWRRLGAPLLLVAVLALVWVTVAPGGVEISGSTRWIEVAAGLRFQPSELAKLALLVFGADVLTRKARLLGDVRHLLVPVLPVTLLLAALVMLQPDLGTTVLLCAIASGLLFLAGTPLRTLASLTALGLAAGFQLILAAPYRRRRLFAFLDPTADPQNTGYHLIQGQLALGSGGLLGVGLGASRQKWSYVPNAHTDFIFAIIGEELGLLGTLAVVALFIVFAYAGVRVARRAPDPFGRHLAGGVTIWIVVTALINMGAVVGLLPITGVPLPLVSFGGSSMIVLLTALGLLLSIARQERARVRTPVLATVAAGGAASRRGPTRTGVRAGARAAGPGARGGRR
ncbi:MAG TPA: putative lipid II flippase FtsW [Actinomycetes bacterium]|nr:putative lipid II flippase FtsW [Actinomycetes bacterium]